MNSGWMRKGGRSRPCVLTQADCAPERDLIWLPGHLSRSSFSQFGCVQLPKLFTSRVQGIRVPCDFTSNLTENARVSLHLVVR